MKRLELTDKVYGRWTVEGFDCIKHGETYWRCRCVCGAIGSRLGQSLISGNSKSCGCLRKEVNSESMRITNTKHGHNIPGRKSAEYSVWTSMIRRCTAKTAANYYLYGGAGITIFPEWRKDFLVFLRDVGPRPSRSHSLDRFPNPNGNYEPGNVRWATASQQQRNRRNSTFLSFQNRRMQINDWAEETGIPKYVIAQRIKRGWDAERILTAPIRQVGRR